MAKIFLAWELGGGLGHCVKLAPLAVELVARGHEVYFAARDVATAQRVFQVPAVKYLQAPCLMTRSEHAPQRPRTFSQVLEQVGFGDDRQLLSLVEAWRNLLDLIRPSAIVCEHAPSALLASRWGDIRRAVIGTGFSLPPDVSPLPDLCPWMGAPSVSFLAEEQKLLDRVNRLLTADLLPPLDRLSQLYSDVDEQFLMTYRELDHHPGRHQLGRPAEYLGSWSLRGGAEPHWPQGDGPQVFAYLKSLPGPSRLETALALLRELPIRTLAYVPRATKSVLSLQSRALRISSDPVDISAVVQNCELAILNGTAGTATQCLLGGVPLLMLPQYLEQVVFSHRVAELGAGLMAPPNRVELLAAQLWKLLQHDRYRQAAQTFAEPYAGLNALERQTELIDRLEALLTRRTTAALPVKNHNWSLAAASVN